MVPFLNGPSRSVPGVRRPGTLWRWIALPLLLLAPTTALAQPRPYLYGMGRYKSTWAGRPQSYDVQIWDHMSAMGATMSGAELVWVDAEPQPGVYNWDAIAYTDFEVDNLLARGIEPYFFLGLTPAWAALRPDLPPHRTPPSEAYVDEFMDFHRFVANRYKGRVKHYFFWNEPNGCSWINDGCSNGNGYVLYTKWLIRCAQAIKEADPDCKLIAGRLDYHAGVTSGWQYVQGMYANGAGPHIDGIAIHPYDWAGTIHWQALTDVHNVMVANGDGNKPVWITEYGWNSTDYQSTANKMTYVLNELRKPEWSFVQMANYLVLNDGGGVENYGLMDANLNPRAGYHAFANLDKSWPSFYDFTADQASGEAPLAVQFTDLSSAAGMTGWSWDFGDGQTSTERHPAHVYSAEGIYTVTLTVTASGGGETIEKESYIRVGSFPKVAFLGGQLPPTPSDASIIAHLRGKGLVVDAYDDEPANRPSAATIAAGHDLVMASSTVLSVNVAGEFRNQSKPFVFWESSLAFNGREGLADGPTTEPGLTQLRVLDNTHPITAGLPAGLVALTTAGADYSRCTGAVAPGVSVLAASPNNNGHSMILAAEPGAMLLDGQPAAGRRAMLYLYDTTWMSANPAGRKIVDNAVAWGLGAVTPDFDASATLGVAPMNVQFTDVSTGPLTGWRWDFGDGQVSTLRHPQHTYSLPGVYDVVLTLTTAGGEVALTRTALIEVVDKVPGDFDHDQDVDIADFGVMQLCLRGVGGGLVPECAETDLDADFDVDSADVSLLVGCMSGEGVPADPNCLP